MVALVTSKSTLALAVLRSVATSRAARSTTKPTPTVTARRTGRRSRATSGSSRRGGGRGFRRSRAVILQRLTDQLRHGDSLALREFLEGTPHHRRQGGGDPLARLLLAGSSRLLPAAPPADRLHLDGDVAEVGAAHEALVGGEVGRPAGEGDLALL